MVHEAWKMSARKDQEASTPLKWNDAGQLKDWFVNVLKMDNDPNLDEAARLIRDNGGRSIDHLHGIGASFLTSIGVNGLCCPSIGKQAKGQG